jgi:hypothetical protein
VSTSEVGSEIGADSPSAGGSTIGAGAAATLVGSTTFFLATFFFVRLVAAGTALAFLVARLADFLATFFALPTLFALLDFFDATFFKGLALAAVRFAFATGRFFVLLFFFAMVTLLLAMLRLVAVRVSLKKSAVI